MTAWEEQRLLVAWSYFRVRLSASSHYVSNVVIPPAGKTWHYFSGPKFVARGVVVVEMKVHNRGLSDSLERGDARFRWLKSGWSTRKMSCSRYQLAAPGTIGSRGFRESIFLFSFRSQQVLPQDKQLISWEELKLREVDCKRPGEQLKTITSQKQKNVDDC